MSDNKLEVALCNLPASAQRYYAGTGKIPPADIHGHRTRGSDSSIYDEICVLCGATDGNPHGDLLDRPCRHPVPDLPGTEPTETEVSSTTRLEEALEQIRLYVEAGAMHLQASAPDGNNPAGYKGPHPCDCIAFADDVVDIVRNLVAASQPGCSSEFSVPSVKPPELRPYLSPNEMGTLDALSRAAHPGNIAVSPFSSEHEAWLIGQDKDAYMGFVTIATGMHKSDADYMVGLWRADRRIRRGA